MKTIPSCSFVCSAPLAALLILTSNIALAQAAITHQITLSAGDSWCDDGMIAGLLDQVNLFRSQNGVPALRMDSLGMKDAELRAVQFSAYMAVHSPGSPGFNPHQGYDTTAASLGYQIVSENLAYIAIDPAYVVYAAWQDPLHIAAMLDRTANVAGVSCVHSNGIVYWTYEPGYSGSSTTTSPTLNSEQVAFLTLINNYRLGNGAGTLQVSVALQNSSQWMSTDLATNNYFSHTDALLRSPGTRLIAFGYTYNPWGENLAAGFSDAQSTLNQWINACDPDSSGACTYAHRNNMLNPSFKVIGIGRAYSATSTYSWYWTTDFGGVVDQVLNPSNPAPDISSFTALPGTTNLGQTTTLSWNISGAVSVSIDNGVGDVSDVTSKAVSPSQTTTYTLTATNIGGATTAHVTVSVNAIFDSQPPTAPVIVSANLASSNEIDLTWSPSADNVGITGYQITRNGSLLKTVLGSVTTYADMTGQAGTTYTYSVKSFDAAGNYSPDSNKLQVSTSSTPTAPKISSKVGLFRPAAFMMVGQDVNGNIAWDPGIDQAAFFGTTGDTIIYGDWDGTGTTKVGIFRASVGMFALDMNGNGAWDPGIDTFGFFGQPGDVPIVGDWNGDGRTKVGIYRPTTALFAMDYNGNLAYDAGTDKAHQFGLVGDTPIIGDWNGDGKAKVGVFRSGLWILDSNNNLTVDAGDTQGTIGQAGDTPLLGDWNGDGRTKVGIYRSSVGMFAEDYNGNLAWDNGVDRAGVFGAAGSTPVVGDWTGTGVTRVGVFYGNGYWGLDINGNLVWDAGVKWGGFGSGSGDTPVVGKWQ